MQWRVSIDTTAVVVLGVVCLLAGPGLAQTTRSVRFEVTAADGLIANPVNGRLIVVIAPAAGPRAAPLRQRIGSVGSEATPIAAVDVDRFHGSRTLVIDETAAAFPVTSLRDLPPGDYDVQAVLDVSRYPKLTNAAGNWFSRPRRVSITRDTDLVVRLVLNQQIPAEAVPPDTDYVRYVHFRSERLSTFHGRPYFLSAAVIVPRAFDVEVERRYPLRVSIGGYGRRYTVAERLMRPGSGFRRAWLADDAPKMLRLLLDGAGPYGDPYQVNSDNNGPYGDAVVYELIPHIEERFRGVGEPQARVVDGLSTGGWSALALQVFYPDSFNGVWSYCPDSVDFRAVQQLNIYDDANAYVLDGAERPSRRQVNGAIRYTMRHELMMENVLGHGDRWTESGRQWGAWNAVYGGRGDDGRPVPLWDPVTGQIDPQAALHWQRYDLRHILARDWAELAPKLNGRIGIWIGEMDDYYLNDAVHLLDDFLSALDPSFRIRIVYGPGEGHCWVPHTAQELLMEMGDRLGAKP